jgi:hypothetical protein
MTANITSVTVLFGHGIKREEYGPTKKAEVSITATVAENEDGAIILAQIGSLALAKVADLLNAPKPDTVVSASIAEANVTENPPPARRGRPKKDDPLPASVVEDTASVLEGGTAASPESTQDEWSAGADAIEITDQEILSATSKRAGELGAREPIVKLIATFATRTEGAPFKVQEIPQNQRKDYLQKLAALTA